MTNIDNKLIRKILIVISTAATLIAIASAIILLFVPRTAICPGPDSTKLAFSHIMQDLDDRVFPEASDQ